METFYRLHVMTRQKLGVPVQPKSFFRRLSEQVLQRGFGFVGVVTKENEPIAAAVFLTYNNRMIYKYAASHSNALEHRPNDCLVHNAIQLATEEGFDDALDVGPGGNAGRNHNQIRGVNRRSR